MEHYESRRLQNDCLIKMEVKDKKNKINIIDETIENLKPQLKEYTEKAEYFNTIKLN